MLKRKQPSGHKNRLKAKARALAAGGLMPRAPHSKEFASLTGISRLEAKNYCAWLEGRMSTDNYLVSVKGLEALARVQTAITSERQLAVDEALLAAVEKHEALQHGEHLVHLEPATASEPAMVGEYLPREPDENADVPTNQE